MVIDHIGIVVKKIEEGVEQWRSLFGYVPQNEKITNTRQKVNVIFLYKKDSLLVKLIEPIDSQSPVYKFAQRGGGLHHICFKCDNIDAELNRLKTKGLHVLSESQPGEAFNNNNIAFVYAKQGLNIELIDTDEKTGFTFNPENHVS